MQYDEPPKKKSFPLQKSVFRGRNLSELPPDNENWPAEAFLDIITKKQKKSLKNIFSLNFKK